MKTITTKDTRAIATSTGTSMSIIMNTSTGTIITTKRMA